MRQPQSVLPPFKCFEGDRKFITRGSHMEYTGLGDTSTETVIVLLIWWTVCLKSTRSLKALWITETERSLTASLVTAPFSHGLQQQGGSFASRHSHGLQPFDGCLVSSHSNCLHANISFLLLLLLFFIFIVFYLTFTSLRLLKGYFKKRFTVLCF